VSPLSIPDAAHARPPNARALSAGTGSVDGSIPDYLEPFVVEQDPSRYSAIDQAVWRFVLLQLHDRLAHSAHPSYVRGLAESGISAERIPSIEQMNERLGAIGWRAVCVDGFIPPRAFQAFQALGVLPIAAEIRSIEHLPYTPAPDIIHEAAGHAPILVDPRYAAYVRASGEVALRAFASPADARVDRAVRLLSELKEAAQTLPTDLQAAERELTLSIASLGVPSEALRVTRLYWWTAEYGLVGSPNDYRLYGAGLLSSLGESHFCHRDEVEKRPLSAACVEVGYDITRPQPQLFVARDFEHLHTVLGEVAGGLSYATGGVPAARTALASQELCTIRLAGEVDIIGTLSELSELPEGLLLCLESGAALVEHGRLSARARGPYLVPVGALADGTDPRRSANVGANGQARLQLEYASGIVASGIVTEQSGHHSETCLWLRDFRLSCPGRPPFGQSEPYPLLLAARLITAGAGSTCPEVSPLGASEGEQATRTRTRPRVPKLRRVSHAERQLRGYYERSAALPNLPFPERRAALEALHSELEARLPHEWLLRWNLLECLIELGALDSQLGRDLRARLGALEHYYAGKHPIAMGLDYLSSRGGG
jgi:phenylalanine-4-hydroxylase